MNERRALLAILCVLPTALRLGLAQQAPADAHLTTAISRSAGLQVVDGQLWGAGEAYKVRFLDDGVEFTPALGERAPRNYPLTFRVVSISRGATLVPLAATAPRAEGLRVEYDRGAAVERYDVGVDQLEQSFVFATRPSGTGDLVVRGRLATELEVTTDGDGLRLSLPDVGGCTIGGVVGIDARGARVRGRVSYADGILELSLPSAFVDGAALPFVLDPPIAGASVVSGTGGGDDRNPSVAYDASNDVYLVVWERIFSATDHDIYAHRVSRSAVPVGTTLFVDTTFDLTTEPQVANCDARDAFVVVYGRNGDIFARAVNAATGLMAGGVFVAGGTATQLFGCVASDTVNPQVLCVWQRNPQVRTDPRIIQAASVVVAPNLTLTPNPGRDLVTGNSVNRPRVSKSDRGSGRHAMVFERDVNGVAAPFLRVIDGNGNLLAGDLALSTSTSTLLQTLPEVDGDGTNWVVAWQTATGTARTSSNFASVSFDPASSQLALNASASMGVALGEDYLAPRVTWIADSCLVGVKAAASSGSVSAALARSLDPFTCFACEGEFPLGVLTRLEGSPGGCSVQATGGTGEDALLTWEQVLTNNGDIIVRGWRTVDGNTTSLGGGCGRGGSNRATCARSPNGGFAHRLRDALPIAPTVFVLSPAQGSFACGPCVIVPDLTGAIMLLSATNVGGDASVPVVIPSLSPLIGVPLFTQWATVDLTTPACFLGLHLSNALRVVIES
ncbi:MAG: hypothetical protein R3F56_22910 [Planctomycetota bacterium]